MSSITQTLTAEQALQIALDRIEDLEEEILQLREQRDDARERANRAEMRVYAQMLEGGYLDQLLANGNLKAVQKVVYFVIRAMVRELRTEQDGAPVINLGEVATATGLSTDTVSKVTNELDKAGILRKITEKISLGKGRVKSTTRISLGVFANDPEFMRLATKSGKHEHGGKRCVNCGSKRLDLYNVYVCKDCGYQHVEIVKDCPTVEPLDDERDEGHTGMHGGVHGRTEKHGGVQ